MGHPDPWVHRSRNMCCTTCMFFVPKPRPDVPASAASLGRCRRHAPTMGGYPVVYRTDWCGDHKLDEEKALVSAEQIREEGRVVTKGLARD